LNYLQNIRKLLSLGYYFSYTYDLTLSKVKRATNCQTEVRFQWNHHLYKDLKKFNIDKKWQVPLIQGLVGYANAFIQGKKLEYFLISRRSCFKAGTRFNARGIDDDGNPANFVESEQIIYYNCYCCSHLQIRGSVPLFWQQRGISAATKITRSYDLTNPAFLKHFEDVYNNWGRVVCVNLMAKHKKEEQMITEAYEAHIKGNNLPHVRYEYFDFHAACKGQRYDKINPLLTKLQPMIENFRFYAEDTVKKTIQLTQKGVIRTNCLDCLDRTNVFQGKVAMVIFDAIMRQLGVDLQATFGQDVLSQLDNDNPKQQHPFIIQFKNLWADNGDMISMHYAGTGSVISTVTRTGKKDFFGMLDHASKTITRFYVGNLSNEDLVKQECIDMLLGQHTESVNVFGETFEKAVKQREREFASYEEISLFVVSWNLGGFNPTNSFDMTHMFNFEDNPAPDVIVVAFQEYIELSTKNIMSSASDPQRIALWKEIIIGNLKKFDNYIPVKEQTMVGLLLMVFAKERLSPRISRVNVDNVKTGLAGTVGNKGASIIKLYIDDSSFCFINCHLEAGTKNNNYRLVNLIDIHNRAFQTGGVGKKRDERIMSLDYKFLIGDTNFRVNTGNAEARAMIDDYINLRGNNRINEANDILSTLLSYDQLNQSKSSNDILEKYQEGAITFLPTYKYDSYSNVYDSSKKQRVPSWTDRILWSCDFGIIKQLFYNRREYKESDHRPVVAYFIVEVKKIDKQKKEEVLRKVYETDTNLKQIVEAEEEALKEESANRKPSFFGPSFTNVGEANINLLEPEDKTKTEVVKDLL